jgi:DNA-binding response OmpR family regulator
VAQRVLVAEDELIVAVDLCDTVAEAGFEVEGPHTGISSAMLSFQKAKPDLAIIDVSLEGGNVFAFAREMADQDVPIIFHCDQHPPKEVSAFFPTATTLMKPCPPAEVIKAVNKVLESG